MRHHLKVIGVGVCIGVLLCAVRIGLQIDRAVFWHRYWIAGAAAVLGAVLCYILYIGRYAKRMRGAIAHYEKGEIRIYMDEVEDMLYTAKGRNLRNTLKIDLSVGHYAMGEYDRAVRILEEMFEEPMRDGTKLVHRLNLGLYYFRTAQNDKAMELYHAEEKEFARFRENRYYGGNVALLDMLAAIESRRYDEAGKLLAKARQTWKFPRLQKEYQLIEEKLARRKG